MRLKRGFLMPPLMLDEMSPFYQKCMDRFVADLTTVRPAVEEGSYNLRFPLLPDGHPIGLGEGTSNLSLGPWFWHDYIPQCRRGSPPDRQRSTSGWPAS